jgi:hypothetical protein
MGAEQSIRFSQFHKVPRLQIIPIIGFAGSGKTELLALPTLLWVHNPVYGTVYCSTPTNVAVDNFAERLAKVSQQVNKLVGPTAGHLPLIIRGHSIDSEVETFITMVNGGVYADDPYTTGTWKQHLSICEWLLKLVCFKNFSLDMHDSPAILEGAKAFATFPKFGALRDWVGGKIDYRDIDAQGSDSPRAVLRSLAITILRKADAVCTTPFLAMDPKYSAWNRRAKVTVLDEAGAMLMVDAVSVWIPDGRPLRMAGDERQLPPTVMNKGEVRNGLTANRFGYMASISILQHAKGVAWPCFVLNTQYRIVNGGFDTAQNVIYHDVANFKYAQQTALGAHAIASKTETWAP